MRTAIAAGLLTIVLIPVAAARQPSGSSSVTVVASPPVRGAGGQYAGNRPPLAPTPLVKLPIGSITPGGWLRGQLELMRDGMTGHMEELSHWVQPKNNAWLSRIGEGENGWEELPYWLKGAGDLGYVLGDERLTALATRWCEGVMAAQRSDGYFGSEENRTGGPENFQLGVAGKLKGPDLWPQMPMLDTLKSYYEMTVHAGREDTRVLEFMRRYFRWQAELPREQLLPSSWQKLRGGDNLESVLWLYNRTGEAWLLDLARTLHERTSPWKDKIASWHGVNFCQGFREPAVWSQVSKDPADLAATVRNYNEMMGIYGQVPGGMFGADENCRPGKIDPRQAAETCSMVEFMNSFEQLAAITGDGVWADRCEEVAFNSLPAAFTPDYRALHYLTSPNMVQLDRENKAPGIANNGTMISFDPGEVYRCCQHNHAMGWPYYAEHLWMATPDGGLAAMLYSQSVVKAKVAGGVEVTVTEETEYPFDEAVALKIGLAKPARFPLYLRAPVWCERATVVVKNAGGTEVGAGERKLGTGADAPRGEYFKIDREWADGDRVELTLHMNTTTRQWGANKNSVSVRRGPLWYSLKIGERYERYGENKTWPGLEVFPTTPWNYGLVLDSGAGQAELSFGKRDGGVASQPWTTESAPVWLEAKARRIDAWQQDRTGLVSELQASPVKSAAPVETVTMIPMGAARLRIAAFPVIGDGPDARPWTPPPPSYHVASYEHDDINAISDGKEPSKSSDHSIPRFTWWSHKGTSEWVTYKFEEPRRISACLVYWFDDTGVGACRVPESWRLQYREGEKWIDVADADGYGVKPDRFNRAAFTPVVTGEMRMQVKLRPGFSGGILEWRVE